ncbi:MAG: hypothetical protein AAGH99_10775 [Planctomycetota bacterium]
MGFLGWLVQKIPAKSVKRAVRYRAALSTLKCLHHQVVHVSRELAFAMYWTDEFDLDDFSTKAMELCGACRNTLGNLLGLNAHKLHCCIKLFPKECDGKDIATWVRSKPYDNRPKKSKLGDSHPIKNNSVWCALSGLNDGKTNWTRARVFCCNDLIKRDAEGIFFSSRKNWKKYYKSTLVLPLRVTHDSAHDEFVDLGYITFDSPLVDAFAGMPDIYDYRESPEKYRELCDSNPTFHLAAAMADMISMFLLEPLVRADVHSKD